MNLTKTFPKMSDNDWRKLQLSIDTKKEAIEHLRNSLTK